MTFYFGLSHGSYLSQDRKYSKYINYLAYTNNSDRYFKFMDRFLG